jgi:hypothetical protein
MPTDKTVPAGQQPSSDEFSLRPCRSVPKILRGSELPPVLADDFSDGKPDDIYVVQARRLSAHDAAKLAALRADVQEGLDDIAAGRVSRMDREGYLEEIIEKWKEETRKQPN